MDMTTRLLQGSCVKMSDFLIKKLDNPIPEGFFDMYQCCPTNERQNITLPVLQTKKKSWGNKESFSSNSEVQNERVKCKAPKGGKKHECY